MTIEEKLKKNSHYKEQESLLLVTFELKSLLKALKKSNVDKHGESCDANLSKYIDNCTSTETKDNDINTLHSNLNFYRKNIKNSIGERLANVTFRLRFCANKFAKDLPLHHVAKNLSNKQCYNRTVYLEYLYLISDYILKCFKDYSFYNKTFLLINELASTQNIDIEKYFKAMLIYKEQCFKFKELNNNNNN